MILGVKFAKAEEQQDREKAKQGLKNAIIGFLLIFVLLLALKIMMPNMIGWVNKNAGTQQVINPNSVVTATPAQQAEALFATTFSSLNTKIKTEA